MNLDDRRCRDEHHNHSNKNTDFPDIMNRNHRQSRDDPQRRSNQLTNFPNFTSRDDQRCHDEPPNHFHQLTDASNNMNCIIHQTQVDTHYAPVSCVDRGMIPSSQRIVAVPEPHQIYVN